ncbi:MAG: DUF4917 family protein [Acidimicrobiia bacterium]
MTLLRPWSEISGRFRHSLLIGNGASRAVSESFAYESLLEVAGRPSQVQPLDARDRQVFELVNETDFERVLGEIDRAQSIARLAGVSDLDALAEQYVRVRSSLIDAVHTVHPLYADLSSNRLERVRDSLLHFASVFTTNYDLLLYWAMTAGGGSRLDRFRDYFWNPEISFDLTDTGVAPGKTRVLYLHGGLHLFDPPDGSTVKASGSEGDSAWSVYSPLLALTFHYRGATYPLFVAEGSSGRKLTAITSNDYLNFAYSEWIGHFLPQTSPFESLVVFGHSLGTGDEHLVRPAIAQLQQAERRGEPLPEIAVSLRPDNSTALDARKQYYRARLGRDEVEFFDASTHPLGFPPS